jgi:hypothetical protein
MDPADLIGASKVGNCPRDPQNPVETACRQVHRRGSVGEELAAGLVGRRDLVEEVAVGFGVRARAVAVIAVGLHLPGGGDPPSDLGAALGWRGQSEIGGRDGRYFDVQVDAVEQRPGDPRLVIRGAARRAAAGERGIAEMAATTRVHRRDQLDPRGEGHVGVGTSDADAAGFERLAQRIEHRPLEFGELVEEQHPKMGEANLTRPYAKTAADQRRHGSAMVGRAERAAAADFPPARSPATDATIETSRASLG